MAWVLGDAARSASEAVASAQLPYNGAGPWVEPCTNLSTIPPHMLQLIRQMRAHAPWIRNVSPIRACERRRDGTLSMHATGRAADVMVPVISGTEGEELANWLVQNAKGLGVQLVIWDHMRWQGSYPVARRFAVYEGNAHNPHVNHVHVELTTVPGPMLAPPTEPIAPQTMAFIRSMIVPLRRPARAPARNPTAASALIGAGLGVIWTLARRRPGAPAPAVGGALVGALVGFLLSPRTASPVATSTNRTRY